MKKVAFIIILFLFSSFAFAQFETKKVWFKNVKSYLFHNPIEIGDLKFNSRIKAGFGIPQGILGINAEFGFDYIAITSGIGYAKMRNTSGFLGYTVGFRGYFMADSRKFRPRLGVHYGLVNIYNENSKNTPVFGPSAVIGFEHKLNDIIVYDIEYTFLFNFLNNYRPTNKELESIAFPQIGIGVFF